MEKEDRKKFGRKTPLVSTRHTAIVAADEPGAAGGNAAGGNSTNATAVDEPFDWGITNWTNMIGYPFLDHHIYDLIRLYTNAFLSGAHVNEYASNGTTCFNNMFNLVQYDFDLLMIKWMYGNT